MENTNKDYKVLLNEFLEQKKMTKYRLSKKTGLSPNVLFNLSLGRSLPNGHSLVKICRELDCQISDIIRVKHDEQHSEKK